ncbi:MAG: hypothetical protein ACREIA_27310 [Opitutaceae bacterium]
MDAEPADEPQLATSRVRLEPSDAQLATLPEFAARWTIAGAVARDLERFLRQWQFSPELAQELSSRMRPREANGDDRTIVPDAALLDRFTPAERVRWYAVPGMHRDNRTHRWPLSIPVERLERLGEDAGFAEAVRRVRDWGVRSQGRILFGDLFAIEDAFASAQQRRDFFRAVLGSDALMVKLDEPDAGSGGYAQHAAYWQVNGRYRAIQPFLNAIARIEEHDRIDIAHLLPRLPRASLHTFPPEFDASSDAAVENGLLAARFFDHAANAGGMLEEGLSAWLAKECVEAAGPHQYGDIVVFEDRIRTSWPYCGVYIADGIIFGREPVAYGAWVFLTMDDVPRMNPRLSAAAPVILRRKEAIERGRRQAVAHGAPAAAWVERAKLSEVREGPWGGFDSTTCCSRRRAIFSIRCRDPRGIRSGASAGSRARRRRRSSQRRRYRTTCAAISPGRSRARRRARAGKCSCGPRGYSSSIRRLRCGRASSGILCTVAARSTTRRT